MSSVEVVTAYRCLECEVISEEDAGSLYECGECGEVFTMDTSADGGSHRCPQDNRFAGKIADMACPDCNAGEVEEIQAVEIDGELVAVEGEGTPEEMIAQALSRKTAEKQKEAEREARIAKEAEGEKERMMALPQVRADEVLPGDTLAYYDEHGSWDAINQRRTQFPLFRVGHVGPDTQTPEKIRIAPPGGTGFMFVSEHDDTFLLVERPEVTPENEPTLEDRMKRANEVFAMVRRQREGS